MGGYIKERAYCKRCNKVTQHRFSLMARCLNCNLEQSQKEHKEAEKNGIGKT